jgi:membrane fusion protein (multidrug efflux system)
MVKKLSLVMVLLTVCYFVFGCSKSDSSDSELKDKIPVEVAPIQLGKVIQSVKYRGDIAAEFEVKVFSKIPDRIEKYYVDEGDAVRKGDPIARVVATTIEQGVKQAEAMLIAVKAQESNLAVEFERAQRLNREDALSKQQFEAIKTQYESIQAQVQQAEAALVSMKSQFSDATVTAPISGIIGKRYYENGDMANPALPLVMIVQMERVKIKFNVTEEDLGKLAIGQRTNVNVKAFPDSIFEGEVYKISPILDPATRMAEVEVLVNNAKGLLKPGMYAEVEVITGVIDSVMVVPRFAVIESTTLEKINNVDQVIKNYYVFVVDSGQALQKKLMVRYINHNWLAVDSGISVGDKLVTTGQNNLRDGLAVTITNEEDVKQ